MAGDEGAADRPLSRQEEARFFLDALTDGYGDNPDLRLELRTLARRDQNGDRRPGPAPEWHGMRFDGKTGPREWYCLDRWSVDLASQIAVKLSEDWDVYCGVLPRRGRRGGRFDCPELLWLWSDIDGGTEGPDAAWRLLVASDLPGPHMVVMSGRGLHAYWKLAGPARLRERADFEAVKALLGRLVRKIGGVSPGAHADSSRADTASILRVPGTWNHKQDPPQAVKLIHLQPTYQRHSFAWWSAHLPAAQAYPFHTQRTGRSPGMTTGAADGIPRWALRWASEPAPYGSRHAEMVRVSAVLARDCGLPPQAILPLLQHKAAVSPGPPMDSAEIEQIARWA